MWQHVRSRNRWLVPGAAVGDTVVERETEREREIGRERELERERESSGLKD